MNLDVARNSSGPAPPPPAWRQLALWFAPVYLLSFALLRSYLEVAQLSRGGVFSYYVGAHHVCWYASIMLAIILVVHLVLRVPVERLLWLMYGITVAAIPLLHALVTGRPLHMEYLLGSPKEILTHVVSFAATYERNAPLVAEVVLIFVGMLVIGWAYSRQWWRALVVAVCVHLTLAVLGVAWFGKAPGQAAVLSIVTEIPRKQPLQAVGFVHVATTLTVVLMWRSGVFRRGTRSWAVAALIAAEVWILWIISTGWSGWFSTTFDVAATALPVVTLSFVAVRALRRDRGLVPRPAWAVLGLLLLVQAAVVGPVAVHADIEALSPRDHRNRPVATGGRQSTARRQPPRRPPTSSPSLPTPTPLPTAP